MMMPRQNPVRKAAAKAAKDAENETESLPEPDSSQEEVPAEEEMTPESEEVPTEGEVSEDE